MRPPHDAAHAAKKESEMTTETRREQPRAQAMRAWQDGVSAIFGGYNRQVGQLAPAMWGANVDASQAGEKLNRILESTRELTSAQFALAGEWLRAPFTLPLSTAGGASASGLQSGYTRVFQAYNQLFNAYLAAAVPVRNAVAQSVEQVADTAVKVAKTQADTVHKVTADTVKVQEATTQAAADASNRAAQAATSAVDQAAEIAEKAGKRAQQQAEAATRPLTEQAARLIKGHTSSHGEKIYHLPGQSSYDRTEADVTFATEEAAQAAGFRRAETPGGGKVKGKVTREGDKIYHVAGQVNYDRFDADQLFETEEEAQAAGFRAAHR